MTERLAGTPERIAGQERRERIEDALAASRERIAAVLATAPYPDPASRDPGVLADKERARVERALEEAKNKAAQARLAADAARAGLGILGRLGFPTIDRREADALADVARAAERRVEDAEDSRTHDLRDAKRRGAVRAEVRQAEQARWDCSPRVMDARREEHGNELVQRALEGGDQEIERKAAEDLSGTREEMLRREEEQRKREMAEAAKLELEHVGGSRGDTRDAPAPGLRRWTRSGGKTCSRAAQVRDLQDEAVALGVGLPGITGQAEPDDGIQDDLRLGGIEVAVIEEPVADDVAHHRPRLPGQIARRVRPADRLHNRIRDIHGRIEA